MTGRPVAFQTTVSVVQTGVAVRRRTVFQVAALIAFPAAVGSSCHLIANILLTYFANKVGKS